MKSKIIDIKDLSSLRNNNTGKKIVHCHGVFDIIHLGHIRHFNSAKRFGEILVVTITDDQYVNKGPNRPYNTAIDRALMIASLDIVDYVSINTNPTAVWPIKALKPDYYVKGPDYRNKNDDITGGIHEEEIAVRESGGEIVFTDDETDSSTTILNKFFINYTEEQIGAITSVKDICDQNEIHELIEQLSSLRVLIIGEPIIDTYVYTEPLGLGSKSPIVSSKVLYEENYAGGTMAIANHLTALGCDVGLMIPYTNEKQFHDLLKTSLNDEVQLHSFRVTDWPIPQKTRFVNKFRTQKIFEVNRISNDIWNNNDSQNFIRNLKSTVNDYDLLLVADFGHGIFDKSVINALQSLRIFKAVNVQTNSANQGYNLFIKHESYDYLCIDNRELRLGMHDRRSDIANIIETGLKDNKLSAPLSITLGSDGSLYVDREQKYHRCPIFFKDIIDTTGAGDAYLTITSLLVRLNTPGPLVTFLGNCYAGLKTRIIGNKRPVSKVDLIKTVNAILGY